MVAQEQDQIGPKGVNKAGVGIGTAAPPGTGRCTGTAVVLGLQLRHTSCAVPFPDL